MKINFHFARSLESRIMPRGGAVLAIYDIASQSHDLEMCQYDDIFYFVCIIGVIKGDSLEVLVKVLFTVSYGKN